MKNYQRSIILITGAIIIDFIGRIILKNNISFVLQLEASLFFIISVLFFYLTEKRTIRIRRIKRFELVMGYFFLLGSLRALLIIIGLEVETSNFLIIIFALIIFFIHLTSKKTKNEN
jgi:hypothetical protein